jgi:tetratricopeptide (TPR) repeat protein
MNYLVLHIDLEFIVGAVCADNGNSYPVSNGPDDLLWLYFFNNPHQNKISFGKENRTHFNNREINYYGRFFELIENEQETFITRGIPKPAIELLEYSELLKTLKDKFKEITHENPDNIPTLLTFSLSIGELAKTKMVEYLKSKGFQIDSYTIPLSELVCYYPYSKEDFIPSNGNTVLLLAATNSALHLMKLVFSDKYFMLDGKPKSYEGKGMDPRKQALVKYVVRELNSALGCLTSEKEIEKECAQKEAKAEEWLKRLDALSGKIPLPIKGETLSPMPNAKDKQVLVKKDDIENDTGHYIQELMNIFDVFKSDNVRGDVAAIFLLGDCFHNSLVREKFKNLIAKEKLFEYSNRDIRNILSVYPKIDFNRYISEEARIKAKAKADELKKAEQQALEYEQRKEEKAEEERIAAQKKSEENRKEAAKLYERAVELDKEGKLQDALVNAENADTLDKETAEYKRFAEVVKSKIKELNDRVEKYKSWRKDAENYEQSGDLDSALKAYKNAQEIFDSKELREKIVATERELERQQKEAEKRAEIERQYKTLIQHAEACITKEAFDTALSKYAEALEIKPDDAYCLEQIKIINDSILQKQNREKAQTIVAEADKMFEKKQWDDAKRKYTEALKLCPNDTAIQSKIKEYAAKIKAIDDAFKDLLFDANALIKRGKSEQAMLKLKEALKIQPDDKEVKEKIDKLNKKLDFDRSFEQDKSPRIKKTGGKVSKSGIDTTTNDNCNFGNSPIKKKTKTSKVIESGTKKTDKEDGFLGTTASKTVKEIHKNKIVINEDDFLKKNKT